MRLGERPLEEGAHTNDWNFQIKAKRTLASNCCTSIMGCLCLFGVINMRAAQRSGATHLLGPARSPNKQHAKCPGKNAFRDREQTSRYSFFYRVTGSLECGATRKNLVPEPNMLRLAPASSAVQQTYGLAPKIG
jgi:hypothetical protein